MTTPYIPTTTPSTAAAAGSTVWYDLPTASVFPTVALGNIKKFGALPGTKSRTYDNTRVDQKKSDGTTNDPIVHKRPTNRREISDLKITIGFKKSDVATLYGLQDVDKLWGIKYSDNSTHAYLGFLTEIVPLPNDGDEVCFDLTIAIDSEPLFTPAA